MRTFISSYMPNRVVEYVNWRRTAAESYIPEANWCLVSQWFSYRESLLHTPLYKAKTPLCLTTCPKVPSIVFGASGVRVCNRT